MNATAAPSHDLAARMRADIRQLTHPIRVAIRGRVHTHAPLLDQLAQAAIPSGAARRGPERRRIPDSQPPVHLDAVDALAEVYVAIARWHARLRLPSPPEYRHGCTHGTCREILLHRLSGVSGPLCHRAGLHRVDWFKAALHALAAAAPTLAPSIADELSGAVHGWWRRAATVTGWQPEQLLRLR